MGQLGVTIWTIVDHQSNQKSGAHCTLLRSRFAIPARGAPIYSKGIEKLTVTSRLVIVRGKGGDAQRQPAGLPFAITVFERHKSQ